MDETKSIMLAGETNRSGTLRFDGGSRGNPGNAGCGFALIINPNTDKQETVQGAFYLGNHLTNNYAEYVGLIEGLKRAIALGVSDIFIEGDSMLVIKQSAGLWKVNSPSLLPLHLKVVELLSCFKNHAFGHILRAKNKESDELANMAMDFPHVYQWNGIN